MMCEEYVNYIDDLIENELDEQSAQQVNLHIFACPSCASVYKTLKSEKEIYSHYLFDAEPSSELSVSFMKKLSLEANKSAPFAEQILLKTNWKAGVFNYFRLNPVMAGLALLLIIGSGFTVWIFTANGKNIGIETAAKVEQFKQPETFVEPTKTVLDEKINSQPIKITNDFSNAAINKNANERKSKNEKYVLIPIEKNIAVKTAEFSKKTKSKKSKNENIVSPESSVLNEEVKMHDLLAKTLENETFKQIEKIELLLRAFRNARSGDGSELYDIAYEKEQAKKLLMKNVQLRRGAENYGTLYAEEILSKVEPYLLDISNLENKTSPEKVLDIKQRVKNQNIIASLQVYK